MSLLSRARRGALAIVASAAVCTAVLVVAPGSADASNDSSSAVAAATALPTVQISDGGTGGIVWDQVISGDTVYAAGSFSTATDPDGTVTPRSNLLAYSLTTGKLITTFAPPAFNGEIRSVAISPDGGTLYVGGAFTTVGGDKSYQRVAALNATTGTVVTSFRPLVDSTVNSVTATADRVYIGGSFGRVNNITRPKVAALTTGGTLVTSFAPTLGCSAGSCNVQTMVLSPLGDRLLIGGTFVSVNNNAKINAYGLAKFNTANGALMPFAANSQTNGVWNAGAGGAITSLTTDGTSVYGTGQRYQDGKVNNLEGSFKASWGGTLTWVADCHGDTYDIAVAGSVAYTASHAHYCGNLGTGGFTQTPLPWAHHYAGAFTTAATGTNRADQYGYPSHAGQPSPSLLDFYPDFTAGTVTGQATWSVATNGNYVVYGGEFTKVNGVAQHGLVRFATRSTLAGLGVHPNVGPQLESHPVTGWSELTTSATPVYDNNPIKGLTLNSAAAGEERLTWPGYMDPDGSTLTYSIYRDNDTTTPVRTITTTGPWWDAAPLTWTDSVDPGSKHTYRISVTDSDGNVAWVNTSDGTAGWSSGTAAAAGSLSSYADAVLSDGATRYWPLTGGGTITDAASTDNVTASLGTDPSGPLAGSSAVTLASGDSATSGQLAAFTPNNLSEEIWFKTTSTAGGRLAGWTDVRTGQSNADRALSLTSTGQVTFSVIRGSTATITSGNGYNDGKWHQAVATLGANGMRLYVDGVQRAANPTITTGSTYPARWGIGGGFTGSLGQASVYSSALGADQVAAHWRAATASSPIAVIDGFNRTVSGSWGVNTNPQNTPGQAWRTSSATKTTFSVSSSAGHISLAAKSAQGLETTPGATGNTDLYAEITPRTAATGGGTVVALVGRAVSKTTMYRARLVFTSSKAVQVQLTRVLSGRETILASSTVIASAPVGTTVKLRFDITGTSTMMLAARAWTGAVEPSTWSVTATDATPVLGAASTVGVWAAASRTATKLPAKVDVDRFTLSLLP